MCARRTISGAIGERIAFSVFKQAVRSFSADSISAKGANLAPLEKFPSFYSLAQEVSNKRKTLSLDCLQAVYDDLKEVNDWKTGLNLFKRLRSSELLDEKLRSKIVFWIVQAHYESRLSPESCWKFISRLSKANIPISNDVYTYASRVSVFANCEKTKHIAAKFLEENAGKECQGPLIVCKSEGLAPKAKVSLKLKKNNPSLETVCGLIFSSCAPHTRELLTYSGLTEKTPEARYVRAANLDEELCISLVKEAVKAANSQCEIEIYPFSKSASSLNFLKDALVCAFRAIFYSRGIPFLRTFSQSLEFKDAKVKTCARIAYAFSLKDYLFTKNESETDYAECLDAFKTLISAYSSPKSAISIYRDISAYAHYSDMHYSRKEASGLEVVDEITKHILTCPEKGLNLNKSLFPSLAVYLASVLSKGNLDAFKTLEGVIQSHMCEFNENNASYFEALLHSCKILRESSKSRGADIVLSSSILRAEINKVPLDSKTMVNILDAFTSSDVMSSSYFYTGLTDICLKLTSLVKYFIENNYKTLNTEFYIYAMRAHLTNKMYQDFEYIYKFLRMKNVHLGETFYLAYVREYMKSPQGCVYVANEFRFHLNRIVGEKKLSWSREIINAVLECCLKSQVTTSIMAFVQEHYKSVSHENFLAVRDHLLKFGSLCDKEMSLLREMQLSQEAQQVG